MFSSFISHEIHRFEPLEELRDIHELFLKHLKVNKGERETRSLFLFAMEQIDGLDQKSLLLNKKTDRPEEYLKCLDSIVNGIPIQYHFGKSWFCDLELTVNPSVLIPRPETEELVQWIIADNKDKELSILDVGTGSGCIAIALAKNLNSARISACDLSAEALVVAKSNAELHGLSIDFIQCDALIDPLSDADIIVCNPPYIPKQERSEMPLDVVDHEPEMALFVPDSKPLLFYERIIEITWTRKSSCYVEIHEDYKSDLEQLLYKFGGSFHFKKDLQGKFRMLRFTANETI